MQNEVYIFIFLRQISIPCQVPDVDRINEDKCELTRTPYGWRFASEVLSVITLSLH
jgi:hypothetical protein